MPAAFTHIMITQHAAKEIEKDLSINQKTLFNKYLPFIYLGSLLPDFPYYMKGKLASQIWGKTIHAKNVKTLFANGLNLSKRTKDKASVALFLGFTTHAISDMVFHPLTNELVGPYKGIKNMNAHRYTEAVHDVYLYKKNNFNLNKEKKLISILRLSLKNKRAMNMWIEMLETTHPKKSKPPMNDWQNNFVEMLQDKKALNPFLVCRFVIGSNIYFNGKDDLRDDLVPRFIKNMPYPRSNYNNKNKKPVNFDFAFNKAIKETVKLWKMILNDIELDKEASLRKFPDISLNKGLEIIDNKKVPLFWK